jgi:hypothetical protein
MRIVLVAILLALSMPATAQTAAPTAPAATPATAAPAARRRGGDITKEEYIERAKRAAERRFDRMDLNHDGILTADERRSVREQRAQRRAARSQ